MIAQPAGGPASGPAPTAPTPTPTPTPIPATVVIPDWGNQVSLLQTKQPAFWLYVVVIAICGILLASTEFTYLQYSVIAFVVGAILLALFAVPIFLLIGVLDLFEREPLSLMVGAFLWGAVAVFPLALATNDAFLELWVKLLGSGLGIGWLTALVPPPVEETFKFLGTVTIFLIARSEFDDVLDGFVYGALVGLGFQVTEDMFYFFTHFVGPAQGVNEIGALIEGYWIRIISSGLYSHPLYAGVSGMGLAYWATRLDQPLQRRRMFLVGGLLLAMAMHIFWNAPILNDLLGNDPGPLNWLVFSAIKGIPLLLFIGFMVYLATRREQTYFQAIMGPEVGTDVVTPDELRGLSDLRSRFGVRRAMRARKGPIAGRLLARIQREQLRYAMLATQTLANRDTMLAAQSELIRTLRTELNAMPDTPHPIAAMAVPAGAQPVAGAAAGGPAWVGGPTGAAAPTTSRPTWQPATPTPTWPMAVQPTVAPDQPAGPTWPTVAPAQPVTPAQPMATAQPANAVAAQPTAATPTWQPTSSATVQPASAQPAWPAQATASGATPAAQPTQWAQPTAAQPAQTPAWRPAAPATPAGPPGWAPTHRAALAGQQSWDQPDASRPMTPLAGGLDLMVIQRVGDWARVAAINGWSGWVDARLLVVRQ